MRTKAQREKIVKAIAETRDRLPEINYRILVKHLVTKDTLVCYSYGEAIHFIERKASEKSHIAISKELSVRYIMAVFILEKRVQKEFLIEISTPVITNEVVKKKKNG